MSKPDLPAKVQALALRLADLRKRERGHMDLGNCLICHGPEHAGPCDRPIVLRKSDDYIDPKNANDPKKRIKNIGGELDNMPKAGKDAGKGKDDGSGGQISKGPKLSKEGLDWSRPGRDAFKRMTPEQHQAAAVDQAAKGSGDMAQQHQNATGFPGAKPNVFSPEAHKALADLQAAHVQTGGRGATKLHPAVAKELGTMGLIQPHRQYTGENDQQGWATGMHSLTEAGRAVKFGKNAGCGPAGMLDPSQTKMRFGKGEIPAKKPDGSAVPCAAHHALPGGKCANCGGTGGKHIKNPKNPSNWADDVREGVKNDTARSAALAARSKMTKAEAIQGSAHHLNGLNAALSRNDQGSAARHARMCSIYERLLGGDPQKGFLPETEALAGRLGKSEAPLDFKAHTFDQEVERLWKAWTQMTPAGGGFGKPQGAAKLPGMTARGGGQVSPGAPPTKPGQAVKPVVGPAGAGGPKPPGSFLSAMHTKIFGAGKTAGAAPPSAGSPAASMVPKAPGGPGAIAPQKPASGLPPAPGMGAPAGGAGKPKVNKPINTVTTGHPGARAPGIK